MWLLESKLSVEYWALSISPKKRRRKNKPYRLVRFSVQFFNDLIANIEGLGIANIEVNRTIISRHVTLYRP